MRFQVRVVSSNSVQPKKSFSSDSLDEILKDFKRLIETPGEGAKIVGYYIEKVEEEGKDGST